MRGLLALVLTASTVAGAAPRETRFESWSDDLFARARSEHRFVLLDVAAVWCHWCHVMDETTYRDAEVVKLLDARFIAVRADADADPELSRRYEDWGWPATIVLAPDGSEIVKRRGYIPPEAMRSLLQAIIDDPSPGPSVHPEPVWQPSTSARLSPSMQKTLERTFVAEFDRAHAGWGTVHKFLDPEPLELAMSTPRYYEMARRTLDAALALVDPVWGGMYQYSDAVDWSSPHYEKIISVQASAIELYARAFALWHDPRYLHAAREIARYLTERLRGSDGAFFVSEDADVSAEVPGKVYYAHDDAGRRALGMPHIDTHIYARENGWAIAALARLAVVDPSGPWLDDARRAAAFVEQHRRRSDGTFAHGEHDRSGPYLGDTLAMADAYVALAAVDSAADWRQKAIAAARAIDEQFRWGAGYVSVRAAEHARGAFRQPSRLVDENVGVVELACSLQMRDMAARAMRFLASPTLLEARPMSPNVLVADRLLDR